MIYLKNPLCLGMEESEYKEMLALGGMRQKHFEKNEVILSAGCTTHEIGLVLSGSVNIENLDLWGSKSILSNIGAGQVFGETYAFSRETLMVDAVAAHQTDILFWNLDILVHTPHPASTWQPKFIRNLLQISLRKNLALSQRIFCTTPKTIRGRLLVYLSNQAAKAGSNYFKIPFDRQGLADYLNVDRSALSKELGKMRDEGILTTRPIFYSGIWIFSSTRRIPQAPGSQNLSGICYRSPCAKISRSPSGFSVQPRKRSAGGCLSICQTRRQKPAAIILRFRLTGRDWRTI